MKLGNKLGISGLAFMASAALIEFTPARNTRAGGLSVLLQWGSIGLFVFAGVLKPRWWLLLPVAFVGCLVWLLSLGH
jgi:hypothetical protein